MHGYLSKALPARDLVAALEAVHAGELVVSEPPGRARTTSGLDWPGRGEGLTDRESEILALITQGKSNAEVAALTYLSPNTVKSYIRTIYRKIDVASRTQAVLWGVSNGFTPIITASSTGAAGPDDRPAESWTGSQPSSLSAAISSGSRRRPAAVTFSSRWSTEPVPGMVSIVSERANSHAKAIWWSVAS